MPTRIDLGELTRGGEVRNLSGQERGVAARRHFGLPGLDGSSEPVEVFVPNEITTLTTSFFQGMFAESVHALGGRERFLTHYRFDASPIVLRQLDRGIQNVTTRRSQVLAA
jgi:hypothetical protein